MVQVEMDGMRITSGDAVGVVRGQQPIDRTLTLAGAANFITGIEEIDNTKIKYGDVNIDVDFLSGHGYAKLELADHYVLNGIIRKANVICQTDDAEDNALRIPVDINELEHGKRQVTIYYDGSKPGYGSTTVAFSKALESYCKTQAGMQFTKRQQQAQQAQQHTAQRSNAREYRTHAINQRA